MSRRKPKPQSTDPREGVNIFALMNSAAPDLTPCCKAPMAKGLLEIPYCPACGQIYRPDGKPEGKWRFVREAEK